MKKEYQSPDYEVILLSAEDVVTGSAWNTEEEPMMAFRMNSDSVWD